MIHTRNTFSTLLCIMIIATGLQFYFIFTHYYVTEQDATKRADHQLLQGRLPRKILISGADEDTNEDTKRRDANHQRNGTGDGGVSIKSPDPGPDRRLSSRDLFDLVRTRTNGTKGKAVSQAIASLKSRFQQHEGPVRLPPHQMVELEDDSDSEEESTQNIHIWQGNPGNRTLQQQQYREQMLGFIKDSKPSGQAGGNVKRYKVIDGLLVARAVAREQTDFVVRNKPRPSSSAPKDRQETAENPKVIIEKSASNNHTEISILNGTNWKRYLDPHEYRYILNPSKACVRSRGGGYQRIQLLILVSSSLLNFARRDVIRNTWGTSANLKSQHGGVAVKTFFLLGNNPQIDFSSIEVESRLYGDVIMEDFLDTYLNLTVKTVMGLKWASRFCSNAKYVMKTDDDIAINTPHLLAELRTMPWRNFVGGKVALNYPVLRSEHDKFYVPVGIYEEQSYPPYVVGLGYVMSMNLVQSVYAAAKKTPLFPWEDVYIGLLLQRLRIRPYPIKHFFTGGYFKDANSLDIDELLIPPLMRTSTIHQLTIEQMYKVWSLWSDERREKKSCLKNGRCRAKL